MLTPSEFVDAANAIFAALEDNKISYVINTGLDDGFFMVTVVRRGYYWEILFLPRGVAVFKHVNAMSGVFVPSSLNDLLYGPVLWKI